MENNIDLKNSLRVIKNMADKDSWFGEHGHAWPVSLMPFGYANACVEVVSREDEKAGAIYRELIEAWEEPVIARPSAVLRSDSTSSSCRLATKSE